MSAGLIITLSVIVFVCVLLLVLKLVVRGVQQRLAREIQWKFSPDEMVAATTRANFVGQKSCGLKQIRGNGALVLTKEKLYFLMAVPRREYDIPIHQIKSVKLQKSFLGKMVLCPILCVEYGDGEDTDVLGWIVPDWERWKQGIESQLD